MTAIPSFMIDEVCKTEKGIKSKNFCVPLGIETAVFEGKEKPEFTADRKAEQPIII